MNSYRGYAHICISIEIVIFLYCFGNLDGECVNKKVKDHVKHHLKKTQYASTQKVSRYNCIHDIASMMIVRKKHCLHWVLK